MSQRKTSRKKSAASSAAAGSGAPLLASEQVKTLREMFPDWEADELEALLGEHHNDLEIVIDLIVNHKVSKWEPIKKELKTRKRDDTVAHDLSHAAAAAANSYINSQLELSRGKHLRKDFGGRPDRPERGEKRREKKSVASRKDAATASGGAAAAAAPASSTSTGVSSGSSNSNANTSASAPGGSWASALSKDALKVKTKRASAETTTATDNEPTYTKPSIEASYEQPAAAEPQQEAAASYPRAYAAQKAASVVPTTSWASAIKPKAKPQPKKVQAQPAKETVEEMHFQQESLLVVPEGVAETLAPEVEAVVEPVTEPVAEQLAELEIPVSAVSVVESEVVLPQQVSNVGVSFGSLSIQAQEPTAEEMAPELVQVTQPAQTTTSQTQPETHKPQTGAATGDFAVKNVAAQPQQQQQAYPYEQQQNVSGATGAANQVFEYYSHFQNQQQFPQQVAAGTMPTQFGYPSFDYSPYGQVAQGGLDSMSQPGYYPNHAANGSRDGTGNAEGAKNVNITQSPLVSHPMNQQGLQNHQQSQQIPGAAPFAYPNYYYNYYSTPFYGNGAGMAAGNNTAYGMQQPHQAHQAHQQGSESGSAPDAEHTGTQGVASLQAAQAANQFYAAQYYGNPNQFGSRAGYPYSGYPSNEPYPQGGQAGEQSGEQQGQQGSQQAPVPNGAPQYPQQNAQYGGYQKYPQYGSYQDSSQYRWY
ncbi:hypothetical protein METBISCDRAFT_22126 [Metschnikowia bicuspidata]|uniref:RNA polymerase II degradation factor 1 n=1 Tax=Metschnikowia bicuspidata TaxID=27322 RepID=A0A4P9ZF68_9ASCO|nr:hypothetical protein METBISCDRAFT_22126 [Metschnikowia bicuspidata]